MKFNSISHLRANLKESFDDNFFSRQSSAFHKDKRKYWSKVHQTLIIHRYDGSKVFYEPVIEEGSTLYVLRLIKGDN